MYVGGDLVYPGKHDTQTRQQSSKFLYSVANELDKYNSYCGWEPGLNVDP